MNRLIFHVDVNSAFLSWSAVRYLEKTGVDLRHVPSAVGGSREKRTGVILAKSIPAKKAGVKTGEPVSMALRKCPELMIVPPDSRLYDRASRAFMEICAAYTPIVEKFSIDECFLDMTGTALLYPDPIAIANTIRRRIRSELGFTVNIGVGENKLLAKMASDFEKPDKVHTLFCHEIPKKLWPLPVGDLFMTGKATCEKLESLNIHTIGELAACDEKVLCSLLGNKHGSQLYARAHGRDETPVLAVSEEAKGYSMSTTLEEDVTDRVSAKRILLALADSVSARMRADKARCACIAVTIRANDFKDHSHQKTLSTPTDVTTEIYRHVCALLDALWDPRIPLRLLGVSLTRLSRTETEQISFFSDPKHLKDEKIDKAVDAIRSRFGMDTIVRGAVYHAPETPDKKNRAGQENES